MAFPTELFLRLIGPPGLRNFVSPARRDLLPQAKSGHRSNWRLERHVYAPPASGFGDLVVVVARGIRAPQTGGAPDRKLCDRTGPLWQSHDDHGTASTQTSSDCLTIDENDAKAFKTSTINRSRGSEHTSAASSDDTTTRPPTRSPHRAASAGDQDFLSSPDFIAKFTRERPGFFAAKSLRTTPSSHHRASDSEDDTITTERRPLLLLRAPIKQRQHAKEPVQQEEDSFLASARSRGQDSPTSPPHSISAEGSIRRARYIQPAASTQPAKMGWICCRCSTANTTAAFTCKRCRHQGDCCFDCYSYSRERSAQQAQEIGGKRHPKESPGRLVENSSPRQEVADNTGVMKPRAGHPLPDHPQLLHMSEKADCLLVGVDADHGSEIEKSKSISQGYGYSVMIARMPTSFHFSRLQSLGPQRIPEKCRDATDNARASHFIDSALLDCKDVV
ncbi:hypothetical protein M409DRAFT_49286 [Zasmidium cellare ATCC 36951]|uniref:RanBP2-type domain-containing protein n=1 Tax=Zasmidium cellare ATCC 36951 TaxID=1080233 RepID=A0A6A6D047_ZASCE|nr:uncharacterized protein M409DRAFT_49286 [Zasmidium cellare ATCC 36951]KAF2172751.1 hypothetical protein M409DRAFT_49286 [Zasmidium cellare ATCC 36951]